MTIDSSWTEPVVVDSENPPEYPYNKIQQSESGHLIEMDDTPNRERVRVQHRAGTFLEMQPDGEVHKIYGNGYEIVLGDKDVQITGQCNITIEGACVVTIKGDSLMKVEGNVTQQVEGDVTQTVDGTTKIVGKGDVDIASSGDISLQAQAINVDGQLNVTGSVAATQSVSALGNLNAGLQCFATLGMVTPGYISAGSPVPLYPIPGWVSGIMVTDMVRTMVMDRIIYDIHNHVVLSKDFGVTSFPTPLM